MDYKRPIDYFLTHFKFEIISFNLWFENNKLQYVKELFSALYYKYKETFSIFQIFTIFFFWLI
jgi:hypothetical protein